MSYSLTSKCHDCAKYAGYPAHKTCIDRHIVDGAIATIHSLGTGNGHEGAGIIEMKCSNFVEKKD